VAFFLVSESEHQLISEWLTLVYSGQVDLLHN
jgi:hypothetical protein